MNEGAVVDFHPTAELTDEEYFRRRRRLRVILGTLTLFLAVLMASGLWLAAAKEGSNRALRLADLRAAPEPEKRLGAQPGLVVGEVTTDTVALPTKAAADPRFAFLLLGYGGGAHDGAYLTDSIMVAIADPKQKTLTLLSIPRDCWVPWLFDGKTAVYNKLNTGYALAQYTSLYPNRAPHYTGDQAGGNLAKDTVSRLLGVPIANYLALDFAGFRQMINAVGGIDVNVPESFTSLYPANDNPAIDPSWTYVRFTKGVEHMNGERAIQFARAREVINNPAESNDFARSRRQRLIMEAFKTKLLAPDGILRLPQLLTIAAGHVDTDYALPDVGQFRELLMDWKDVKIYQTALTANNYLEEGTGPGGAYALVPSTPDRSWTQVRAFARRLWEDPATGVAMAATRVVVVNKTGKAGAGTALSNVLAELGYRVGTPATGPVQAKSLLIDRTGGRAVPVIAQLERDLGVRIEVSAEAPAIVSDDLIIELGADDVELADLRVPADDAPSSAFGILSQGGWSPDTADAASPTATPQSVPTRTATPAATASPTPVRTVLPTPTPVPVARPAPVTKPGKKR